MPVVQSRLTDTGSYELFDERGQPIGRVVAASSSRPVGRDSGTVLLIRN